MKHILIIAAAITGLATPALAQEKPGNCALWSELSAQTIKRDARTKGPQRAVVVDALTTYSEAQTKIADAQMAQSYEQGKAFGYSKEKMDELQSNFDKMKVDFEKLKGENAKLKKEKSKLADKLSKVPATKPVTRKTESTKKVEKVDMSKLSNYERIAMKNGLPTV
jgi:regulator of replication initiation timing